MEERASESKLVLDISMSLDGFIAGPRDNPRAPMGVGGERLLQWYLKSVADESEAAEVGEDKLDELIQGASETRTEDNGHRTNLDEELDDAAVVGAMITGRRTYENAHGWGGSFVLPVPIFVLTHTPPEPGNVPEGNTPFTFVTEGIESAVRQAQTAAGGKIVAVQSASAAQQCLNAGLLDEIHIHLVPVLLGKGRRLFDHLSIAPTDLEQISVDGTGGMTHVDFRVLR